MVLSFLIGKLQYLISSCSKAIKRLLFLRSYTTSSIPKKRQFERQKLVHAGAHLVLSFLIGKLQDLTSSCSKIIERLLFLRSETTLSVSKKKKNSFNDGTWFTQNLLWSFFFYIIRKMQDLTISCLELFKKLLF